MKRLKQNLSGVSYEEKKFPLCLFETLEGSAEHLESLFCGLTDAAGKNIQNKNKVVRKYDINKGASSKC